MRNRASRAKTYLTCSTRFKYRGRENISLFVLNGLFAWPLLEFYEEFYEAVSRTRERRFCIVVFAVVQFFVEFLCSREAISIRGSDSFAYYELNACWEMEIGETIAP